MSYVSASDKKSKAVEHFLEPLIQNKASPEGVKRCEKLGSLPFWCGDKKLHLTDTNYSKKRCCFNHVIGLPCHAGNGNEGPIADWQDDCIKQILEQLKDKDTWTPIQILKARQLGLSELACRFTLFLSLGGFNNFATGTIIPLITGTTTDLAENNLRRIGNLLLNSGNGSCIRKQVIPFIELENGSRLKVFSSQEESVTGYEKIKVAFFDEAAKTRHAISDQAWFNSLIPTLRNSKALFIIASTFKGVQPQKFFYTNYYDKQSEFLKMKYDIYAAEGDLYSSEEIKKMLSQRGIDVEQEYLCKASTSSNSVFAAITDDDRGDFGDWASISQNENAVNFEEWLVN